MAVDTIPVETGRIKFANVVTNDVPLWAVFPEGLASVTVELDQSDVLDPGLFQAQGLAATASA